MTSADRAGWLSAFAARLARERVPVSVSLELTRRCNLRCIHCYLGPQEELAEHGAAEMTTDQVISVVDQAVAAGCLQLLITGGDPMMRRDFPTIYRHARLRGLVVTVFCDGVLVTDATVELFREHPPFLVEISLYGATAPVYEAVTRVPGSYRRCLDGVRRLLDGGVRVGLKTVLMTVNEHELEAMRALAHDLDVPFRMDAAVFPCLPDGDRAPLDLRVDAERGVAAELADETVLQSLRSYVAERVDQPANGRLYSCGAGVTGLSIDPYGWASPCLMATHVRANLLERGLAEVWNDELSGLQERSPRTDWECISCEMRSACTVCPACNLVETGREDGRPGWVCAATAARWRRLGGRPTGGPASIGVVTAEAVEEGTTV